MLSSTSSVSSLNRTFDHLMQAPVIPGGSHLAYWDSDKAGAMVDSRALEISNHWGPVDAQAELPAERLSELFGTVASYVTPSVRQVMFQHPHSLLCNDRLSNFLPALTRLFSRGSFM